MKTTTPIKFWMIVLISLGLASSMCIGLFGGIVLDRQLFNRPPAATLFPTLAPLPTITEPAETPTWVLPGNTPAPTLTPTIVAPPISGQGLDQNLINEAWKLIQQQYVDRDALQGQELTYGAIRGMVDALGDTGHSVFLTADQSKARDDSLNGEYVGIGIYVESRNGLIMVVSPIDGSPAQKAGILPGDIIEKVNGADVGGQPLNQVISHILGPEGTQVTLTIFTPSTNLAKELTLTRAKITIVNVTWQALPGTQIAHLRLTQFAKNSGADLQKALKEIQAQKMTGLILDLRNNPGGLVTEVVTVTSQFLKSGNVFQEKDAAGRIRNIPVTPGGIATTLPMVVLINIGSASGSEITAGAIQDAGRAQLIGETTFGTGTVITSFPLSDGSQLQLAILEWLTPTGRVIWHTGIKPDEEVKLDLNVIPLTPESERTMSAADLQASKDKQLLRAIELLKALK
jgi:carboxyl-terminal processing protease